MSFGSMAAAKADYAVPSPPSDGVSDLTFSPNGTLLTAGSWDNGVSVLLASPLLVYYIIMPLCVVHRRGTAESYHLDAHSRRGV